MKTQTERLELILLTPAQLNLWMDDIGTLEKELDCSYRAEPMQGDFLSIVSNQYKICLNDPQNYLWHSFFFIVRKEDRVVVGSSDFKSVPNGDGEVEIGYGLGKEYERKGYMTEAVKAMCDLALSQKGVLAVTAETELNNLPSHRVLERCEFTRCKEGETL